MHPHDLFGNAPRKSVDYSKVAMRCALMIGGLMGFLYFMYGAVTPCGIFKHKFKSDYAQQIAASVSKETNPFAAAGAGLGLALGNSMLDGMLDSLTPIQCVRALANYDEGIMREAMNPTRGGLRAAR